ncbi:PAS domain-containing sensor histidine kinase, partial [bacterium]|nr:PAS domain-containing sensor histidine kinase [bacterium]
SMSGIAVTDPRYMIIKYNRKIEDILEMKIINSFDMRQYLHNNFFIKSLNKKILFDFDNFRTGESFEIIRKDNSRKEKVLLISASELRATNNDLTGYIFNFEDVTRIKLYQTTLQETEKMAVLGRLSAKLTHEIKNPLATINSLSQHLVEENEVLNSSERKELLDTVYSEVQRLGVILGDVSKWSRHSCDSETDCFNLREVLDSIIALTSFDFRKRKIHFTFDMDQNDEPLYICGSADRFKQIIFNLLWNAMDVLNESVAEVHKISLNYYNKDEYIYITIKDNGDGMTENELSRIFEPFYTTKREGMGLGLAIVSDIVRSMEGKMTVCSVPSEGTEFGLVFKLFCPEAEING